MATPAGQDMMVLNRFTHEDNMNKTYWIFYSPRGGSRHRGCFHGETTAPLPAATCAVLLSKSAPLAAGLPHPLYWCRQLQQQIHGISDGSSCHDLSYAGKRVIYCRAGNYLFLILMSINFTFNDVRHLYYNILYPFLVEVLFLFKMRKTLIHNKKKSFKLLLRNKMHFGSLKKF